MDSGYLKKERNFLPPSTGENPDRPEGIALTTLIFSV